MASASTRFDLVRQLGHTDGKAEIVAGEIVPMSPTGDLPSSAGGAVYASLRVYARQHGGRAYTDNVAFVVKLPGRDSISPDAAYFTGPRSGMKFLQGAPQFAVEVRSEHDHGRTAEQRIIEKRRDYFAAGTVAVWDVDLESTEVVKLYVGDAQTPVAVFSRGEMAYAEPAVAGWSMPVDELFE